VQQARWYREKERPVPVAAGDRIEVPAVTEELAILSCRGVQPRAFALYYRDLALRSIVQVGVGSGVPSHGDALRRLQPHEKRAFPARFGCEPRV